MGWKQVKGHSYYYESVRVGKRVRTKYVGGGEFGALMASANGLIRAERERQRAAWRAERERVAAEDRPIAEWCRDVEALARLALEAGGFYRHDRGEWRRRGANVKAIESKSRPGRRARYQAPDPGSPLPRPDIPLAELVKRAKAGDVEVRWRLRAMLERGEGGLAERYYYLEMAPLLEIQLVEGLAPKDVLHQELLFNEIRRTAAEVAGPEPSPLERLLAHRVAVCQHVLHQVEWRREAEKSFAADAGQGIAETRVEYHDRRVDGAQRRLMQAVKMLATVRRLQGPGPAVSVKVRQTVNVQAPEDRPSGLSVPELMAAAPRG